VVTVLSLNIGFVKHNRARSFLGKREENTKLLLEFFASLEGKVNGIKGFTILDNAVDLQETLVLTFWETKQDMDAFYSPSNKALADFVEKSKPLMEQMPQRTDYSVVKFKA
jgi:heme-degrading monooxygenase HmoA